MYLFQFSIFHLFNKLIEIQREHILDYSCNWAKRCFLYSCQFGMLLIMFLFHPSRSMAFISIKACCPFFSHECFAVIPLFPMQFLTCVSPSLSFYQIIVQLWEESDFSRVSLFFCFSVCLTHKMELKEKLHPQNYIISNIISISINIFVCHL